jgi:anti-sigma factor RsiW
MRCEEAQELITAWIDNELDATERAAIDAHLKNCLDCVQALERESALKRRVQLMARQMTAPPGLHRKLEEKSASNTTAARPLSWRRWFGEFAFTPLKGAFAAVILLAIAGSFLYTRWSGDKENSVALAALDTHASILSGKTTLLRAVNLPAMRRELAHAVGNRFKPVVLDLSLSKLYPIAGFVQTIEGRDLLVTVYQGDGPTITCFTFLGSETDAPTDAEQFFDAEMGIKFYTFTRGDLTGVLHREGDVLCLLVSKMAPAELLALLRGKSAHA